MESSGSNRMSASPLSALEPFFAKIDIDSPPCTAALPVFYTDKQALPSPGPASDHGPSRWPSAVASKGDMPDHILIYLNGRRMIVDDDQVFGSLVDLLRQSCGLVGTKVGCGEGDCGACTVLVGRPKEGTLRYRTVSSCLQALYQLDGTHIVTIEGLTPPEGLSPIQQAMVEHHGSQCGYCTPGMIAALEGLFESESCVDLAALRTGLTGNLCRCTGYLPILEAGLAVDRARLVLLNSRYPSGPMTEELAARAALPMRIEQHGRHFFSPVTLEDAIEFRVRHPCRAHRLRRNGDRSGSEQAWHGAAGGFVVVENSAS